MSSSSSSSSKQQSHNSSPLLRPSPSSSTAVEPPKPSPRSVIASKVSLNQNETNINKDLGHNYMGVEKISRLHDRDGNAVSAIRIDFKTDKFAQQILDKGYILIDGKRCPVRPYWLPTCVRCHNEGHHVSQCPQKPLTQQRLIELFKQQQMEIEGMMNAFENKWNARLSSLAVVPSRSVNDVDQLLPLFQDLTTVCQQFNQQNVQMQQQLNGVVSRVRDVQMKVTQDQARSQFPIRNGH